MGGVCTLPPERVGFEGGGFAPLPFLFVIHSRPLLGGVLLLSDPPLGRGGRRRQQPRAGVRRDRERGRPRLRALQLHVGLALPARDDGCRGRAARLRQRRRPRRLSRTGQSDRRCVGREAGLPTAGAASPHPPPLPQRSGDAGRRLARAPLRRRHRAGAHHRHRLQHRHRHRRLRQRRLGRRLPRQPGPQSPPAQQRRRQLPRRDDRGGRGRPAVQRHRVVLRLRRRRLARPLRRQLPPVPGGLSHAVLHAQRCRRLLRPTGPPARGESAPAQSSRRHLRGRHRSSWIARSGSHQLGSRRRRLRRRRAGRPLRRQRRHGQPDVAQPRRRHLHRRRLAARRGLQRRRSARGRHGSGGGRPRRRPVDRSVPDPPRARAQHALSQRRSRPVHRPLVGQRAGAAELGDDRLRRRHPRRRRRRHRRPLRRQRRGAPHPEAVGGGREAPVAPPESALPGPRRRPLRRGAG